MEDGGATEINEVGAAPREGREGVTGRARVFRAAAGACAAATVGAVLWALADLGAIGVYFLWDAGPGGLGVVYPVVLAVGYGGLFVGGVGMIFRKDKTLWRGMRRAVWLNLLGGLACVALAPACSAPRWPARETAVPGELPVVYNASYNINLYGKEKLTRFDAHRYEKIYNHLAALKITSRRTVVVPRAVTDEELGMVHTPEWIKKTHDPREVAAVFETGLIARLPEGFVAGRIVGPFRCQTRGTMVAARLAVERGMAGTLGGGFAHAGPERGEGFNLFADVPLAVAALRRSGWRRKVMIVDVDAHHGQGNARLFRDDPSVYVLDVYNRSIYPGRFEEVDAAIQLPAAAGDAEYLERFGKALLEGLNDFSPALVIYVAGVDAFEGDALGGLAVTEEGLFERDKLVIDECTHRRIPLCMTLSGGYWPESWRASARMFEYAAKKFAETWARGET